MFRTCLKFMFLELSYIPCAAHNIQLVIKDGLTLDETYTKLIDRVSTDIVSKSKCSTTIAEELREFNKKLCKKNLTRWNSTLFMIRSVLNLSPAEFSSIRNKLPTKTDKQRTSKKNFSISGTDRKMLEELKTILEMFEFVTDELQGDGVTISKVYPCINYLKTNLTKNFESCEYTENIRLELLNSLNKRFYNFEDNEIYVISSFLDSNFGIDIFEESKKETIKSKVKKLVEIVALKSKLLTQKEVNSSDRTPNSSTRKHQIETKRHLIYLLSE